MGKLMNPRLILILFFSSLAPAAPLQKETSGTFPVEQLDRVLSGDSFECRLPEYAPSSAVRYRVFVRNLGDQLSRQQLETMLADASQIELGHVKFRNYFRLDADLILDGNVLKLVEETPKPALTTPAQLPLRRPPVRRTEHRALRPRPVFRRTMSLNQLMNSRVNLSELNDETSFSEALDILTHSVDPPLPLIVLWSDLERNALIEKDTPIGVEGFQWMSVGLAMDIILRSVSVNGPKLVLVAEGNVLTLGTEQTFDDDRTTRVYSVADLTAVPASLYRW